jgi:hypothetical protein
MPRRRKPPSQTWRTFLLNHSKDLVSIDFFVVSTVTTADTGTWAPRMAAALV